MDQKNYLEEIRFWELPPWSGIVQNEERNKKFFNENKADSSPTPHQGWLNTGRCGSQKWFLVNYKRFHLSPSRGTQSQTVHAERRIISFSAESYRRYQKHSYIIGCSVGEKDWWSLERGWRKRIIRCVDRIHKIRSTLGKATRRMHMVREDLRRNKQPLVLMMCGQICGNLCPMQRKRKQNKDGLSRNQSSTMPDNREEYSSLNQTTKNSSSQWKPLVESVKFRCRQQCLAKYRQRAVDKPTAILGNARQNTLVLSIPTNARDQG